MSLTEQQKTEIEALSIEIGNGWVYPVDNWIDDPRNNGMNYRQLLTAQVAAGSMNAPMKFTGNIQADAYARADYIIDQVNALLWAEAQRLYFAEPSCKRRKN